MKKFFVKINEFFISVEKDPIYIRLMKNPLTYVAGAVLLGIIQVFRINAAGSTWGVTGVFAQWFGSFLSLFGVQEPVAQLPPGGFFHSMNSVSNLGIIVGALLAALFASQFKIKMIKNRKQIVAAVLGGFLMGFGARLAGGCNIGALFSQITQLNLFGWVFAIFLLGGAWIGSKLLLKFFI